MLKPSSDDHTLHCAIGHFHYYCCISRQDAKLADVAMAFLHVASIQQQLQTPGSSGICKSAHNFARDNLKSFLRGLNNGGWVMDTYSFSDQELDGYAY